MKKIDKDFMNTPIEETESVETETTETAENVEVVSTEETAVHVYSIEEVKDIEKHAKKIVNELGKAEKAFTQIACELAWLYDSDRYKAIDTAMSFEKFCETRYGFKKTQAYSLVMLVDRFGYCDAATGEYAILDQWKAYGQTKLINMISLTDAQITENINPKMTVADIKKIVKNLTKGEPLGIDDCETAVTSTDAESTDADAVSIVDTTATVIEETRTQLLASFDSYAEFEEESPTFFKAISDIFKNSQNCKVFISYEC